MHLHDGRTYPRGGSFRRDGSTYNDLLFVVIKTLISRYGDTVRDRRIHMVYNCMTCTVPTLPPQRDDIAGRVMEVGVTQVENSWDSTIAVLEVYENYLQAECQMNCL